MLYLYKRRGTDEHILLEPTFTSQKDLDEFLMEARKFLSWQGETEAASFLASIEFEAYNSRNRFDDEFIVLKFSVSPEDYREWEKAVNSKNFERTFEQIADTLTKLNSDLLPIGFVTCHLERSCPSGNSPYQHSYDSAKVSNQAVFTFQDGQKLAYKNLYFRSRTEITVFDALIRKGLLVFPLPVAVMGQSEHYREPDFVVCHNGKAGILEIHGEKWHPPETAAREHERRRQFNRMGVSVYEVFSANRCLEDPDGVVDEFLQAFTRS